MGEVPTEDRPEHLAEVPLPVGTSVRLERWSEQTRVATPMPNFTGTLAASVRTNETVQISFDTEASNSHTSPVAAITRQSDTQYIIRTRSGSEYLLTDLSGTTRPLTQKTRVAGQAPNSTPVESLGARLKRRILKLLGQ
jgi:hypothetical protein